MAEVNVKMADKMYSTLVTLLEEKNLHFDRDDEKRVVSFSMIGDDIPIDIRIIVDARRQLIVLYSSLPFTVPEDKKDVVSKAVCKTNWNLVDGDFDYDPESGHIVFRLTACYIESVIGKELLDHLVSLSVYYVDEYNDKLLMVSKGVVSYEQYAQSFSD